MQETPHAEGIFHLRKRISLSLSPFQPADGGLMRALRVRRLRLVIREKCRRMDQNNFFQQRLNLQTHYPKYEKNNHKKVTKCLQKHLKSSSRMF